MKTVLITGGTGTIGKALTQHLLEKNYRVIILSRNQGKPSVNPNLVYARWNVSEQTIDSFAIEQADYIINLAGAGVVDKKWDDAYKLEIKNSRVNSGKILVKALKEIPNKVSAIVSASAIGWYGPDSSNNTPFIETAPDDKSFLGATCLAWEQSITPVEQQNKRLVILRTGIVLSNEGGAYVEFKKTLAFGIASILGNGKQIVSWIHIDDLCKLYISAIENESLQGIYNAVAPNPISNKDLMLQLAKQICKHFFITLPVPVIFLKLLMGERSIEILKSTTVSSKKIEDAGFVFDYPTIDVAVTQLCKKK